jgi:hypothetical protein
VTAADVAAGTDVSGKPSASVTALDHATAVELAAVRAQVPASDTGSGVDVGGPGSPVSGTDSGTGTDAASVTHVAVWAADGASARESAAVGLGAADGASATDDASVFDEIIRIGQFASAVGAAGFDSTDSADGELITVSAGAAGFDSTDSASGKFKQLANAGGGRFS